MGKEEWMGMWYDLGWNTTNYLPEKAKGKEDGNCCEGAAIYLSLPTCFPFFFPAVVAFSVQTLFPQFYIISELTINHIIQCFGVGRVRTGEGPG